MEAKYNIYPPEAPRGSRNFAYQNSVPSFYSNHVEHEEDIEMDPSNPRTALEATTLSIEKKKTVVVIGSGDLGRALVSCLVRAGYRAVVASRNPQKNRSRVESVGGEIDNLTSSLHQSDIVLVAIPFEGFKSLPKNLLKRKILVDVSNRPLDYDAREESLAGLLQRLHPQSTVVKAFNTLSAYSLQMGMSQGSKEVPICSDDEGAKLRVMALTRDLGFTPVDFGSLFNAKTIENIPLEFFPGWKSPTIFAFIVWIFSFLLEVLRSDVCSNIKATIEGEDWNWHKFVQLPLQRLYVALGFTALTLLASCYCPGVIAAYLQLHRQTKYSEFPCWLDNWLKGRKQLGLIALFLVTPHLILAIIDSMFYVGLEPWIWRETTYFACGALSFTFLVILGVTSLPSVAASLTWREFSFVQSHLGWAALVLATGHVVFMKWGSIISNNFRCYFLPSSTQIFLILPLLTIVLKLPLLLPCVDSKLQKIRRGHEGPKYTKTRLNADEHRTQNGQRVVYI